jgi:aryl-alcohol dehydrogenase-like predicted oxidoreductase
LLQIKGSIHLDKTSALVTKLAVLMKMRKLGNSGKMISVMGYGCGGYWGYEVFDEKMANRLVHQALDGGVNFFDTGASYSGGNAEKRLGKILKGVNTTGLIIGTKAGTIIRNGRLVKDYSPTSITGQVEGSLINLGLERIPLLQLHGVPDQDLDDVFGTLTKLKKEGKVELIGASCDGAALDYALSYNTLDVVMLTYNLIEKHAILQIEKAYSNGVGVLVKSPLAHTIYSNDLFKIRKLSDLWYLLRVIKNYRSQLMRGRKYRFINSIPGWSAHEIALLYSLDDKVSCVVTGTTNPGHMESNIKTFDRVLPAEIIKLIEDTSA